MVKLSVLIGLVFLVSFLCMIEVARDHRRSRGYYHHQGRLIDYPAGATEAAETSKGAIVDPDHYIYREGLWDGAPIVIQKYNLIFFTVPKVGSTVFKQLFRRMMGHKDWIKISSSLPHNPQTNGLSYLWDFTVEEASEMLADASWTKAVFVRDPKERILSAYLDKAVRNNGNYIRNHCCRGAPTCAIPTTFKEFLEKTVNSCPDPHWMPQTYRMEGRYWPYINFIGRLATVANDTRELLMGLGLWERYGRSGWGQNGTESIFESTSRVRHKTQATDQISDHYSPEVEAIVERIYRADYDNELLGFNRAETLNRAGIPKPEVDTFYDNGVASFEVEDLTAQTKELAKEFGVEIDLVRMTPRYGAIKKQDPLANTPLKRLDRRHYVYGQNSWDASPVVISKFKLLFFTTPKVGCTVFKQLFRRMKGLEDWSKHGEGGNIPHNPNVNGLDYLYQFSEKDALVMLTSKEWTRAIFVREPKDRILSAYLDKGLRKDTKYVKTHCCPRRGLCVKRARGSFKGFLQVISQCSDPHWMPQTYRMMGRYWQYINFVGHIENAEADTRRLLEKVGASKYGESGWGEGGDQPIFASKSTVHHATVARDHTAEYFDRETEAIVNQMYAMDFDNPIFNFTRASVAHL